MSEGGQREGQGWPRWLLCGVTGARGGQGRVRGDSCMQLIVYKFWWFEDT